MAFEIDTGTASEAPFVQSSAVEQGQSVDLTDIVRAERIHRKIIATIESIETVEELDAYWVAESLMLDAFYMMQHVLHDAINNAYEECRAVLSCSREPKLAQADPNPAEPGNSLGITF